MSKPLRFEKSTPTKTHGGLDAPIRTRNTAESSLNHQQVNDWIQGVQRGDPAIVRFVIGISRAGDLEGEADRHIVAHDQGGVRIDAEIQAAIGRDEDAVGYRIEVEPIGWSSNKVSRQARKWSHNSGNAG